MSEIDTVCDRPQAGKDMDTTMDLTGEKFGRLLVLERSENKSKNREKVYKCLCECGNITFVRSYYLRSGTTKSCGCLARAKAGDRVKSYLEKTHKEKTHLPLIASKKPPSNNTSGVKGVCFDKKANKWVAYIEFQRNRIRLGSFRTLEEAKKARENAEEEYYSPIIEKYTNNTTNEI